MSTLFLEYDSCDTCNVDWVSIVTCVISRNMIKGYEYDIWHVCKKTCAKHIVWCQKGGTKRQKSPAAGTDFKKQNCNSTSPWTTLFFGLKKVVW